MDRKLIGGKPNGSSFRLGLGGVSNKGGDLGDMTNESELASVLIDAAKHKGIGFAIADLIKSHAIHHNKNIMVFRGAGVNLIDVVFEDCPKLVTGHGIYNE